MVRWLRQNLGTLALAFLLAVTVWVAAVSQEDPIDEKPFPQLIRINYINLADGLLLVEQPPESATVTVRAPESVWTELTSQDISLEADLEGIEAGTYRVWIRSSIERKPSQITAIDPTFVTITLEPSISRQININVRVFDQPALGYSAEDPIADPPQAMLVGPASLVEQVSELRADVSLADLRETLDQQVTLSTFDQDGNEVDGIQILPEQVRIMVPIRLGSRYRLVSVIPRIEGLETLVATGYYQVTNIDVTPSEVIVFSSDRAVLDALPGFVETVPFDIAGQTQEVERRLPLNLPEGVSMVGEQSVLVQVTIIPVIESLTVSREIEIQGLGPDLYAVISPTTVNVILTGPAATLDALQEEDVRVVLDLLDLDEGTYQLEPQVLVLPTDIEFDAPIPNSIELRITTTPPPTPSPSP
jgi:YbbR domain-containing protein